MVALTVGPIDLKMIQSVYVLVDRAKAVLGVLRSRRVEGICSFRSYLLRLPIPHVALPCLSMGARLTTVEIGFFAMMKNSMLCRPRLSSDSKVKSSY